MPTLHITNGSAAGDTLKTFVGGTVTITADVLHEGPAPRVDGDAWYDIRARFLSSDGDAAVDEVRHDLARSDRTILEARERGDDIVLWFEHDLFDQLLLVRSLDVLAPLNADATDRSVYLICIDRFPGVERFIGLGQLDAAQLASLYPSRAAVTAEQFALASAAWAAFRAPDPNPLMQVAQDARALPFLRDALLRFFAEFPSLENGLSRTEALALAALRGGPLTGGALFAAAQTQEAQPFMGDLPFFDILRGLASARVPLVTIDLPDQLDPARQLVALTAAGRDVLSGRLDHVAVNGIDRWRGGVHLAGRHRSPWRWDARAETLVSWTGDHRTKA